MVVLIRKLAHLQKYLESGYGLGRHQHRSLPVRLVAFVANVFGIGPKGFALVLMALNSSSFIHQDKRLEKEAYAQEQQVL